MHHQQKRDWHLALFSPHEQKTFINNFQTYYLTYKLHSGISLLSRHPVLTGTIYEEASPVCRICAVIFSGGSIDKVLNNGGIGKGFFPLFDKFADGNSGAGGVAN